MPPLLTNAWPLDVIALHGICYQVFSVRKYVATGKLFRNLQCLHQGQPHLVLHLLQQIFRLLQWQHSLGLVISQVTGCLVCLAALECLLLLLGGVVRRFETL